MPLSSSIGIGALRRERLRTARLYFVLDARPHGEDPEARVEAALRGGADIIQIREKTLGRREIERSATTVRRLCDTYSALFVINDDPDLARAVNADGVHVGQDDIAVEEVRAMLGPDVIIGLSTHSREQILASADLAVDHISVGPIWETPTKEGRPAVGLDLIRFAAQNAPHPFFAIGGIDLGNVEEVVEAGAERLCVVRALRDADDPEAVAARLREALGPEAAPGG